MFQGSWGLYTLIEQKCGRVWAILSLWAGIVTLILVAVSTVWSFSERVYSSITLPAFSSLQGMGQFVVSVGITLLVVGGISFIGVRRLRALEALVRHMVDEFLDPMRSRITRLEDNSTDVGSANESAKALENRVLALEAKYMPATAYTPATAFPTQGFMKLASLMGVSNVGPALVIKEARYGTNEREMDVKPVLSSLIKDGQIDILVTNTTMGGDPHKTQRKTLRVEYIFNGVPHRIEVREKGRLVIPPRS